jgi:hypothetical protein
LGSLSFPERFKKKIITVPTLAYRRIRRDMIEAYKILHRKYDPEASSFLKKTSDSGIRFSTRINSNKILHQRFNTAVLRKNSYSVRIAKYWNKLPDNTTNAPSINAFKNRLDKHWKDEDIYYLDYKSEITGSHVNLKWHFHLNK